MRRAIEIEIKDEYIPFCFVFLFKNIIVFLQVPVPAVHYIMYMYRLQITVDHSPISMASLV